MTVSEYKIAADGLGTFFEKTGRVSANATKQRAYYI